MYPFVVACVGMAALSCEPTFKPDGTLSIQNSTFVPTACHVLPFGVGLDFMDDTGAHLELTVAPFQLDDWSTIQLKPNVRYSAPGETPITFRDCATLALTGEGYHAKGKRAVRGEVNLRCNQSGRAVGVLPFRGCF